MHNQRLSCEIQHFGYCVQSKIIDSITTQQKTIILQKEKWLHSVSKELFCLNTVFLKFDVENQIFKGFCPT